MDVLDLVARRILDDECERIGIDGPDASGKTIFANRLSERLERPVMRVSVDDFHNPPEVRYQLGRYIGAQRIYFASCAPHDRATILIDNTDYDAPLIERA